MEQKYFSWMLNAAGGNGSVTQFYDIIIFPREHVINELNHGRLIITIIGVNNKDRKSMSIYADAKFIMNEEYKYINDCTKFEIELPDRENATDNLNAEQMIESNELLKNNINNICKKFDAIVIKLLVDNGVNLDCRHKLFYGYEHGALCPQCLKCLSIPMLV